MPDTGKRAITIAHLEHFVLRWAKEGLELQKTRSVCVTQIPPQQPFLWKLWLWYVTLTDGLDLSTKEKVLLQGIHMRHIKALSLNIQRLRPRISKKMWPWYLSMTLICSLDLGTTTSNLKQYTNEIWKPYHFSFKSFLCHLDICLDRWPWPWYHRKVFITRNTHVK